MFVLFFLLWIILNGRITTEIVLLGVGLTAVFHWFVCKFLGRGLGEDLRWIRKWPRLIWYFAVLVFEIFKANFDVMRLILSPRTEIEPQLVYLRTDLKEDSSRVLLANSITLTPGTITVRLKGEHLQVHCLDSSLAEGIGDSSFVHLLREMEAEK